MAAAVRGAAVKVPLRDPHGNKGAAHRTMAVAAFIAMALPLLISCDHGLGLIESRIRGHIYYLNVDRRPDYVESVRVAALVRVPPQSLGDLVFTSSGVGFRDEASAYDLPAPLSSYVMVAAIWREKGRDWDYGNILGIYGFDPINFTFEAIPVALTQRRPVADSVNIYCDWSFIAAARRNTADAAALRLPHGVGEGR